MDTSNLTYLTGIVCDPKYSQDIKVMALEMAYALGRRDRQIEVCDALDAKAAALQAQVAA